MLLLVYPQRLPLAFTSGVPVEQVLSKCFLKEGHTILEIDKIGFLGKIVYFAYSLPPLEGILAGAGV